MSDGGKRLVSSVPRDPVPIGTRQRHLVGAREDDCAHGVPFAGGESSSRNFGIVLAFFMPGLIRLLNVPKPAWNLERDELFPTWRGALSRGGKKERYRPTSRRGRCRSSVLDLCRRAVVRGLSTVDRELLSLAAGSAC